MNKKHTSSFFIIACMVFLAAASNASAQRNLSQLKINNAAAAIENLVQTDAVGADGKIQHTASFDLKLNNDEATRSIVLAIQSVFTERSVFKTKTAGGSDIQMLISNINSSTMTVTDERLYTGIVIDELKLPEFNAADQAVVKISVKLRASSAAALPKGDRSSNLLLSRKVDILSPYFSVSMGALPCSRISKVSSITIRPGSGTLENFVIELSGADSAPWSQWFATGAGGRKKEQGTINLMSRDFKTVLFRIQLTDVDILSYSVSNSGSAAKATVGLRVRSVTIM